MGIRRGLFFGFLIGSAAATVLAKARRAEAPSSVEAPPEQAASPEAAEQPEHGAVNLRETIERVKHRAEEALDEAQRAQEEKEAELRRQFNEMRRER